MKTNRRLSKILAWAMALALILALAPAVTPATKAAAGDVDIDTAFEGQFKLDIIAWATEMNYGTTTLTAAQVNAVEVISVNAPVNDSTTIKLSGTVDSLKGIDLFTNLDVLECSGTAITGTLDVSALTNLTNLSCDNTGVTELVLPGSPNNLTYLHCYNTDITGTLDVSGFANLKTLACGYTDIMALDLTGLSSLEDLSCENLGITGLDLSGLSSLNRLICDGANIIGPLVLTGCPNLEQLSCSSTRVTELVGLSGLTKLKVLDCSDTDITELILDSNTGLETLVCTNTPLHSLNLGGLGSLQPNQVLVGGNRYYPVATKTVNLADLNLNGFYIISVVTDASGEPDFTNATFDSMTNQLTIIDTDYPVTYRYKTECYIVNDRPGGLGDDEVEFGLLYSVSSDYIQFPDKNFKAAILAIGYGDNIGITPGDAAQVDELDISNTGVTGITSLVGIEYFTNLKELNCEGHELTELNMSANTKLETLNCGGNRLTELDVSANTSLKVLDCAYNELTELDVSANTNLEELNCFGNELAALDISQNTALAWLDCDGNPLTELDVSKNTALTLLFCGANQLTALDVSKNTALDTLNCGGNWLTALDVSANTALMWLYCDENQLTVLDVSANTKLEALSCGDNKLTELDVSANTNLEELNCLGNELAALDISQNTALAWLDCDGNQLTELDVSKNTKLDTLNCAANQLTALDVSKNTALYTLDCSGNWLTALDVSANTSLEDLFCFGNELTALDISQNTALARLDCNSNQLTALDVSKNTALTELYCHENQLTALDVSAIDKLDMLFCYQNKMVSVDDVAGWEKHFTLDDVGDENDPDKPFLFHDPSPVDMPGTPRNLTLTPGDGRITAAWEPPADGGAITGYRLRLDDEDIITKTASERSHTFTGLTNGVAYTVNVWAVNAGGESVEAAAATATCMGEDIPTYTVTVVNGTGGGDYAAGETVSITADAAPAGRTFAQWSSADGVAFASATSVSTTFTMPGKAVTVTAAYRDEDVPTYTVTVVNGTGGGDYAAGETVSITADAAPAGQVFAQWSSADGVAFASATSVSTTFTMPGKAVTVTAAYKKAVGAGIVVDIDVQTLPTVQVVVTIYYNGDVVYRETFSKD